MISKIITNLPEINNEGQITIKSSFITFCVFALNISKNTQLLENISRLAEFADYGFLSEAIKKKITQKVNLNNEEIYYSNKNSKIKIPDNILNEAQIENIFSVETQIVKVHPLNSKLFAFLETNLINFTTGWTSLIAINRNSKTRLFFDIAFYNVNTLSERESYVRKQYFINYFLTTIIPLFDEATKKIKRKLKEHEQLLLLKNFLYDFSGDSGMVDLQKVFDRMKFIMSRLGPLSVQ
jgi:hypothetical protein